MRTGLPDRHGTRACGGGLQCSVEDLLGFQGGFRPEGVTSTGENEVAEGAEECGFLGCGVVVAVFEHPVLVQ